MASPLSPIGRSVDQLVVRPQGSVRPVTPAPSIGRGIPAGIGRVARQLAPDKGPIEGKDRFSSSGTPMSDPGSHRESLRTHRRLPMTPSPSPRSSEVVDEELEKTHREIRQLELQLQMSGYHRHEMQSSDAVPTSGIVGTAHVTSGTGYMSGTAGTFRTASGTDNRLDIIVTSGTGYMSGTSGTVQATSGTRFMSGTNHTPGTMKTTTGTGCRSGTTPASGTVHTTSGIGYISGTQDTVQAISGTGYLSGTSGTGYQPGTISASCLQDILVPDFPEVTALNRQVLPVWAGRLVTAHKTQSRPVMDAPVLVDRLPETMRVTEAAQNTATLFDAHLIESMAPHAQPDRQLVASRLVQVGDNLFQMVTSRSGWTEHVNPVVAYTNPFELKPRNPPGILSSPTEATHVESNMVDASGGRLLSSGVQRMPRKYWLQLDKFDGTNMPLETFLAKLENCTRYNGWTVADKLAHLQANLTGGAAQCLWDVGVENSCSLPHLLTLLRGRFGSEGQAEKFRAELRGRRRKTGETLQSVYQDIRRLMVLAFPGPTNATTEIVGRDSFLDALGDRSFALRIRERKPATMEEALRMAVRFEAYGQAEDPDTGAESRTKPRQVRGSITDVGNEPSKITTSQMETLMARIEQVAQMASQNRASTSSVPSRQTNLPDREIITTPETAALKSSYRPSSNNHGQSRKDARRSGLCFHCSKSGHIARECPAKSVGNPGPRVNGSSGGRLSDAVYLTATIGRRTESCLVDTGCQISLLPERLAPPGPWQEGPKLLRAANGTPIDVVGSVTIDLKLNGFSVRSDFLVSPDIDEIMLGMDFLSSHSTKWDFDHAILTVEGQPLQLRIGSRKIRCRRVVMAEDTTIPPYTQQMVQARAPFRTLSDGPTAALLECRQLRPGINIARVVIPGRQVKVTACLLNTTAEAHTLRQGEQLGVVDAVSSANLTVVGPLHEAEIERMTTSVDSTRWTMVLRHQFRLPETMSVGRLTTR